MTLPVSIIGAPLDLGQSRRGVDMGPSAIRYAGLEERLTAIGLSVSDRGNVVAPEPEALAVDDARARYLPEILDACAALAALVEDSVREGSLPLVLGGDHAIAMGTLAGLAAAGGQPGGVIWIDAHGDLNTPETSPSGNVHGMPLAAALGRSADWFAHDRLAFPALDSSIPLCCRGSGTSSWWRGTSLTGSSTACTDRRTSAGRWTLPSIGGMWRATTSAASTGGSTRAPIAIS